MGNSDKKSWSLFRVNDRKQFDDVGYSTVRWFSEILTPEQKNNLLVWSDGWTQWVPLSQFKETAKPEPEAHKPPPVPEDIENTLSGIINDQIKERVQAKVPATPPKKQEPLKPLRVAKDLQPQTKKPEKVGAEVIMDKRAVPDGKTELGHRVLQFKVDDAQTLSLQIDSRGSQDDRHQVRYQKRFRVRINLPNGGIYETVTLDVSMMGFRVRDPLPKGLPRFFGVELDCQQDGKLYLMCSIIKEKDGRDCHRVRIQVNEQQGKYKSAIMRAG